MTAPQPDHPVPAPRPVPAWDCYIKSGVVPRSRAACELACIDEAVRPVCLGEHADVRHNAQCPEARRLARRAAFWGGVQAAVLLCAIAAVGGAVLLSVWSRTCGLGAAC